MHNRAAASLFRIRYFLRSSEPFCGMKEVLLVGFGAVGALCTLSTVSLSVNAANGNRVYPTLFQTLSSSKEAGWLELRQ